MVGLLRLLAVITFCADGTEMPQIKLIENNVLRLPASQRGVTKIQAGAFESTPPSVYRVILMYTCISVIENGAFLGLEHVQQLDLGNNRIQNLDAHIFMYVGSLQILDLQNNCIEHIDDNGFVGLSVLISLNLNSKRLVELSSTVFLPLANLSNLSMAGNYQHSNSKQTIFQSVT